MKFPLPALKGIMLLCALLFLSTSTLLSQTTVTISPGTNWTDAMLLTSTQPDREYYASTNYSTHPRIEANAWTASSNPDFRRSLIKFNLNVIPTGSTIQSATLYLYSDPTVTSSSNSAGNSQLSGSNAVYFEKVTASWSESGVTWNNQPTTTTSGRIWYPASTSTTQNIQVDIKSFVQSWVNSPSANYGLKMRLENELHYRSRNYASENHPNTAIRPKLVVTYSISNDPLNDPLNNIFARIDKSQIPTGFLEEYGASLVPADVFNGVLTDSNRVSMDAWRMLYASLQTSRTTGTNPLPALSSVNTALDNAEMANGAIPVTMLDIDYNYLRPDAITSNLLRVENNQLVDVAGRTQSPYYQRKAFAATPTRNYSTTGVVSLLFKPELYYKSGSKTLGYIHVDFADGQGYKNVAWNTPISKTYTTTGIKVLKIKVIYTDNSVMECFSEMDVLKVPPSATARYTRTQDFIHTIAPNSNHAGGQAFVRFSRRGTERQITKPLIVVEGFDGHRAAPKIYETNNTFEDFINKIDNTGAYAFNDQLDDVAGYDLIFLDYNYGTDDIRRNAALLEALIIWVNQQKAAAGSTEPNVVMGLSMGGLVGRYCLAKMVKDGVHDPDTRLLITHDSPHRGANTPLGLQALTRGMNSTLLLRGLNFFDLAPRAKQANTILDEPASQQMLIVRATTPTGGFATNTFLDNVYRDMITFGGGAPPYRIIATSQGSQCGTGVLTPGTELLRIEGRAFISPLPWIKRTSYNLEVIVNALPALGQSRRISKFRIWYNKRILSIINININITDKSYNSPSSLLPWDGAPGGTESFKDDFLDGVPSINKGWSKFFDLSLDASAVEEFSFVPTVSALDVTTLNVPALSASYVGGVSLNPVLVSNFIAQERFQVSGVNRFNESHTRYTARQSEWLFNEMENVANNNLNCSNECQPGGITVSGPSTVCTSGSQFNLNGAPPGSLITWTHSGNLIYVSGQGTPYYTVKANSSTTRGSGSVNATLSNICGLAPPITRSFWVGLPDQASKYKLYVQGYSGQTSITLAAQGLYTFKMDPVQGANNYNWQLPSGFSFLEGYDQHSNIASIWTAQQGGSYTLKCFPTGACGSSGTGSQSLSIYIPGGGTGGDPNCPLPPCQIPDPASIYPNPATSKVTLSFSDEVYKSSLKEGYSIKIYNQHQKMVYESKSDKRAWEVDTKKFPKGLYIINVYYKEGVLQEQLIIE